MAEYAACLAHRSRTNRPLALGVLGWDLAVGCTCSPRISAAGFACLSTLRARDIVEARFASKQTDLRSPGFVQQRCMWRCIAGTHAHRLSRSIPGLRSPSTRTRVCLACWLYQVFRPKCTRTSSVTIGSTLCDAVVPPPPTLSCQHGVSAWLPRWLSLPRKPPDALLPPRIRQATRLSEPY